MKKNVLIKSFSVLITLLLVACGGESTSQKSQGGTSVPVENSPNKEEKKKTKKNVVKERIIKKQSLVISPNRKSSGGFYSDMEQMAIADMDGDGNDDLVTTEGRISIFLNRLDTIPTEIFSDTMAARFLMNVDCVSVSIIDFNRDNKNDLFCLQDQVTGKDLTIWINNTTVPGMLQFSQHSTLIPSYHTEYENYLEDINNDGLLDLITVGRKIKLFYQNDPANRLSIFNTTPDYEYDFTLQNQKGYCCTDRATFADLNGDGWKDIVTTYGYGTGVTVFHHSQQADAYPITSFSQSIEVSMDSDSYDVELSDMDQDGDLDIILGHRRVGIFILKQDQGQFLLPVKKDIFGMFKFEIRDINNDQYPDLVYTTGGYGSQMSPMVAVYYTDPTTLDLQSSPAIVFPFDTTESDEYYGPFFALADVDKEGTVDVIHYINKGDIKVSFNNVYEWQSDGAGQFEKVITIDKICYPYLCRDIGEMYEKERGSNAYQGKMTSINITLFNAQFAEQQSLNSSDYTFSTMPIGLTPTVKIIKNDPVMSIAKVELLGAAQSHQGTDSVKSEFALLASSLEDGVFEGGQQQQTIPMDIKFFDPDIVMYETSTKHTGSLGGRSGADQICVNERPSNLPTYLPDTKAWISVNTSDEIQDMLSLHGVPNVGVIRNPSNRWQRFYFRSLYDPSHTMLNSLYADGFLSQQNDTYWTGSSADGSAFKTCNGWTSGSITDRGSYGEASAVNTNRIHAAEDDCNQFKKILCVAFESGL